MKTPDSLRRFLVVAFAGLLPVSAPAAVRISEFQADNADTITDGDGDKSDWIEIYNPDGTAANLAGMALTDDPLVPQKWVFPAGVSLPAGGHLLVWASSKNRVTAGQPLHTNFKLSSAAGGYLGLIAADGTTVVSEFAGYPEQFPDRSYGTSQPVIVSTVIGPAAPCRWLAPVAAVANWNQPGFNDSGWFNAVTGIGYERSTSGILYDSYIGAGGDTETQMYEIISSVYIRLPFNVTNAAGATALTLRMRWEDGFAAFLNGTRLNPPTATETNAPANLGVNSTASAVRDDNLAVLFSTYDISSQRNLLVEGNNVLAIQGLNQASNSSDFLIVPELDVTFAATSPTAPGYLAKPNPGVLNSAPPVLGFLDAPDFSVKRGFYTTPQSLALTTNSTGDGVTIRYTTNGSPPTATTGTLYTGPINVTTTAVIRAGTFRPGYEPSTVKTHTLIFAADVVNQPANPAGYPTTWGNDYNFTTGTLTGPPTVADYRMDPGVTTNPAYSSLMVPALTTTLPVMCLTTSIPNLFDFNNGLYANARLTSNEVAASIEYFNPLDPTGSEVWQEDAGIRMHGGDAPLEHPKKPWRIYFRKQYGVDKLRYPLFPGSPVEEFDKLQLRPGGHDGWAVPFGSADNDLAAHATYMRDRFMRQCELDMGRLTHRGRYVHLYINGLYWGFYDVHEVIDARFFASHKGGNREDWDVIEHSNTSNPLYDLVEGSGTAIDAALAAVRPPTNMSIPANYQALKQLIPMEELIDNLIVQMWGAQNDWMGPVFRGIPNVNLTDASRFFNKNWEAGRRSRGLLPTDGFRWQVWDAEISMGQSLTSLVTTMRVTDFNHTLVGTPATEIPRAAGTPGPIAEIYYALRKYSPEFRRLFSDRLQKHFFNGGAMTTANLQARLQSFRNQLDLPVVPESARWGDVNSGNPVVVTFTRDIHWRSEMNWMRDSYVATRNQTLLNQFAAIGLWSSVAAPTLSQHGGSVAQGYQLSMTNPNAGGTIYYTLDGTDPAAASGGSSEIELTGPNTPASFIVPSAPYSANSWKNLPVPADIANWTSGSAGIGFDANTTFTPHIVSTVANMRNVRASCYLRVPFTLTAAQKASLVGLNLQLKYDDGAFIFLNGSAPLHRPNAPAIAPTWLDTATATRLDTDAVNYAVFDLSSNISSLVADGANLLAIQGLNITAADDDFLCVPRLVGTIATPGTPSGTAIAYSGAITLNTTGPVKARVLQNGSWSAMTDVSFIVGVPASASNLTISEFSYNPAAPSPAEVTAGFTSAQVFEFVELVNISANTVQLTGCRFDDGITFDFTTDSSVQQLAPGQRIVLASNAAALQFRYPGVTIAGTFQAASNLSNSGERLELLAANGSAIGDFIYDDAAPWPTVPDGDGFSLVLIRPFSDPNLALASNWRASAGSGGTPGGDDSDPFTAWASRNSVSGLPGEDPDRNGLSSLMEYALGVTPPAGTNGFLSAQFEMLPALDAANPYVVLRYRVAANADDAIVIPQMSTDLATWTPLTDFAEPPVHEPASGTILYSVRSPQSAAAVQRLHVRLEVQSR